MSPRNEVNQLSALSINVVRKQLIQALSDDEGLHYETIESYLSGVVFELRQILLRDILHVENLDAGIRFYCLQVLLRGDFKKLDTGVFPHSYYEKILQVIAHKGTGLQQLNLKGVWVREYTKLLSKLIEELKKLRVLLIPHMADDSVLKSALTCEHLTVLDISGECAYTADGIMQAKSDSLRVLEIGNYGNKDICQCECNSFDLVAHLIENMPNLMVLRAYSFTGTALLHLHKKNPNFKTKLTYIHDTNTTVPSCQAIINLCPNIENIYLDCPEEGVIGLLKRLKHLNSLKLTKPDLNELFNYFRLCGCNIQALTLNLVKNSALDLSKICEYCCGLLKLELFKMDVRFSNPENYFMSLETVELLYCEMNDTTLKHLLTNSPFLKRIVVGGIIRMTDGDIFRLCAECEFFCLEELWFSCAKSLTITSVELLMSHCPNLKVLGQLNGWDVTTSEVEFLRVLIQSSNINLKILPSDMNMNSDDPYSYEDRY